MSKSEFAEWFRKQHGPRRASLVNVDDLELLDRIEAGKRAAAELRLRLEWDARRESALHAWQVV